MKVIKEDKNALIFEERPYMNAGKNPSKKKQAIVVILLIAFMSAYKLSGSPDLLTNLSITLSTLMFLSPFFLFTLIVLNYLSNLTLQVRIDKKADTFLMRLAAPWPGLLFHRELVKITLSRIMKLRYRRWQVWPVNSFGGMLTFILDDDTKIDFYIPHVYLAYEKYKVIGEKISTYITVPFEIY